MRHRWLLATTLLIVSSSMHMQPETSWSAKNATSATTASDVSSKTRKLRQRDRDRLTKRQRYLRWRARDRKQRAEVKAMFRAAGVPYPAPWLHLRAFKHEGELELWASAGKDQPMTMIKRYAICATSGELGPKRKQGDLQVPEGFYKLVRFTRYSSFHRSMRINYPNRRDRLHRSTGGAILIHGGCATIGCIPIRDAPIEELFRITLASHRKRPKRPITVHIYPRRLDRHGMAALESLAGDDEALLSFWLDLQPAYLLFEKNRRLPTITVGRDRRYHAR